MKRAWSAIADNWAAGTAATISLFLVGLWVRYSEETYRRLYAALEAKGILAALFLALLGIIWLAINLIYEKKKHSLDGIPKGFTLNNERIVSDVADWNIRNHGLLFGDEKIAENKKWLAEKNVATAVPVAIAVLKTADFFREDPIDIERINKEHSEEVAQHEKKYAQLHVEHTESKRKPISSLADIRIMEIIEDHKKK